MNSENNKILKIPSVLACIIKCWEIAEISLRKDIYNYYPDVGEEFITQFFLGKFASILMFASQEGLIESSFLTDLNRAFPHHHSQMAHIANGLIAEVNLHKRNIERITGGDIGLIISRPQVSIEGQSFKIGDYKRGLLCQAKLKRASGKWGSFTKNQISILPERLHYLALLLYSYEDDRRKELKPFMWQRCQLATFPQVRKWLKDDVFTEIENSNDIISSLGNGGIGTDDNKIIDELITPTGNTSLVIKITWPEDHKPESNIRIHTQQNQKTSIPIKLRR